MAKLERDVEDRFFDIITNQKENPSSNAYKVYQRLVYYRFEEIIKNTFPEFIKNISEKKLEKSIFEFLKNPPNTPFVWKIANDYRKFVKKNKIFDSKKYLYELLYFDWIEVKLIMTEYKSQDESTFDWKNSYSLSPTCKIKKFDYDIINKEYKIKRENFLIIYNNFKINEVVFREINQFIFVLLQKINKKESIEETLNLLCTENEIDINEAKTILYEALNELLLDKAINKN
ncbi:MAG: hypothetical protein ACERKK_01255 [Poseidonibacter sp.]|uniref:HvfC family peptide modification chaperone n=2 Tax=Poseidonibacter sp. TaxID=2321188 RepID=UPI00359DF232